MHDLGEDLAGERGHFRRLQHHGAARRDGRSHLADDLVERPVPGGDEGADADRLLDDHRRAAVVFEFEVFRISMAVDRCPRPIGTWARCASEAGAPISSVTAVARSPKRSGTRPGCGPALPGVSRGWSRTSLRMPCGRPSRPCRRRPPSPWKSCPRPLRWPILDIKRLRRNRIDPFAVDVELQVLAHWRPPGPFFVTPEPSAPASRSFQTSILVIGDNWGSPFVATVDAPEAVPQPGTGISAHNRRGSSRCRGPSGRVRPR